MEFATSLSSLRVQIIPPSAPSSTKGYFSLLCFLNKIINFTVESQGSNHPPSAPSSTKGSFSLLCFLNKIINFTVESQDSNHPPICSQLYQGFFFPTLFSEQNQLHCRISGFKSSPHLLPALPRVLFPYFVFWTKSSTSLSNLRVQIIPHLLPALPRVLIPYFVFWTKSCDLSHACYMHN